MLIDEVQEISMEGFQVVNGDYFKNPQRMNGPSATLWYNSISFNKAALNALNSCDRIRMEINSKTKGILIVPVSIKDKDSVRWTKNIKDPIPRKMECKALTSHLYNTWGWKSDYVYRAAGRIVTSGQKVMLLFDFSKTENWKLSDNTRVKYNG